MELQTTSKNNATSNFKNLTQRVTDSATFSPAGVSKGLAWFSFALGLSEVTMARKLCRIAGFDAKFAPLIRIFGFREIMSGVGLVTGKNQNMWLWSRVIGDALDGSLMGYAYATEESNAQRKRLLMAAAFVAPVIALDIFNTIRTSRSRA